MRVIAVCNQKGGVAKTTTTVNLAAFLARDHGQRILVIDADGQCNTTALFEPDAGIPRDTLADLLRMPQNERTEFSVSFWLGTCIVPSSFPGVDLLPGDPTLQALDLSKAEDGEAFTAVLARGLPDLKKRYDYVLIDCPPAFNAASAAALLAADEVLIPIKLDAFALDGMTNLMQQIANMRRINPRLTVLGLLPVMWYRSDPIVKAESALRNAGSARAAADPQEQPRGRHDLRADAADRLQPEERRVPGLPAAGHAACRGGRPRPPETGTDDRGRDVRRPSPTGARRES